MYGTIEELQEKIRSLPKKQPRQMVFWGCSIDDDQVQRDEPAARRDEYTGMGPPTHSIDFASVNWYGDPHDFSESQRAVVGVLWNAWENGTPDVAYTTVLKEADSMADDVRDLFRSHKAWGTMIQRSSKCGGRPGCLRLVGKEGRS